MALINIKNLSFKYPHSNKLALDNINLSIDEGDFVLICGSSGCGKTTLLSHLKKELIPVGESSGEVLFYSEAIKDMDKFQSAINIGYLMQNPDAQIISDKVWHQLAFGLENIGTKASVIRRKVAETSNFFGIQDLFRQETTTLSGGQKQIVNLATILLLNPKVLVLDEPTSQLDPLAVSDFLECLRKVNEELSTTIIMVEHRLEQVLSIASKVVVMDKGKIIGLNSPTKIAFDIKEIDSKHTFLQALPTSMRLALDLDITSSLPLNIKEGKKLLRDNFKYDCFEEEEKEILSKKVKVELKNLYFRYDKKDNDILRKTSLKIYEHQLFCLLGNNGAGKSTLINCLVGISKPYRGQVKIDNIPLAKSKTKMAYLPQNPTLLFSKDSVLEELTYQSKANNNTIMSYAEAFELIPLLEQHPYDISGGQQQKLALVKLLLLEPEILILDEPTKGLDYVNKRYLAYVLKKLIKQGLTIIMVSHDIEFCANFGDECAMLFDGEIVSQEDARTFFKDNNFYTTATVKLTRNIFDNTIIYKDVLALCHKQLNK
ncbi:MAG: ATP-binding cassette domain-containing protein [Bacilli bacterium]|jgi:energy-coupling factor transport system ATP-binding protein|nr:ATP-binding cassette domain-containing protein [Bacilli bacterium]